MDQGGVDSAGSEDDDDDDDKRRKTGGGDGSSGELPRKTPHRAGAAATRRKQQARPEPPKNVTKPSVATAANDGFVQKQPKPEVGPMALKDAAPTTFPSQQATNTFPPTVIRRENDGAAAAVPNPNVNNGASNNNGSRGGEFAAATGTNPERMYNMDNGATMESGQGSVSYCAAAGGKTQSPIQPSSVSLPSPTPCTTPTGMFCDAMAVNSYDGPQMEQMGWALSPMMSGTSLPQ